MTDFYSKISTRVSYQKMIDESQNHESNPVTYFSDRIAEKVIEGQPGNILEIGCGSGLVYRRLVAKGFVGRYLGIEMSEEVIEMNKLTFPEVQWIKDSVYNLKDSLTGSYDCVFSAFVLEHLIYPNRALEIMRSKLKKGGKLILVFPDFVEYGLLPSQRVGRRHNLSSFSKLKKMYFFDSVVSFIEAKILRNKLRSLPGRYGEFVINCNPVCLDSELEVIYPDCDAVYLSYKKEIERWAQRNNMKVEYPFGVDGEFKNISFMILRDERHPDL
jgi:2-polyprenyl-3-methyl-5-hydroxy-6-metoxy-1,4-benzoquinol methylase